MYLATAPYEKSSILIRLDPAKSITDPSSLHIPTCPMKGANHDTTGRGVQTKQHGYFALLGLISSSGHRSCWILGRELLLSRPNVGFSSITEVNIKQMSAKDFLPEQVHHKQHPLTWCEYPKRISKVCKRTLLTQLKFRYKNECLSPARLMAQRQINNVIKMINRTYSWQLTWTIWSAYDIVRFWCHATTHESRLISSLKAILGWFLFKSRRWSLYIVATPFSLFVPKTNYNKQFLNTYELAFLQDFAFRVKYSLYLARLVHRGKQFPSILYWIIYLHKISEDQIKHKCTTYMLCFIKSLNTSEPPQTK